MRFTQPTIHHVLYIESDSVQIAKYGFPRGETKSIWISLDDENERKQLDRKLAELHERGKIRLYIVSACNHGDDYNSEWLFEELNALSGDLL